MNHSLFIIMLLLLQLGGRSYPGALIETGQAAHLAPSAMEEATQLILDVPEFQMWLHPETPGRLPLKLIKNEHITNDFRLSKFGQPVRLVDAAIIKKEHIKDAIQIEFSESGQDTLRFKLTHKIESAYMHGRLFPLKKQWGILVDGYGDICYNNE